jgi:MoaA/NifB/PqqE/SkfB family radical SAM enzyme
VVKTRSLYQNYYLFVKELKKYLLIMKTSTKHSLEFKNRTYKNIIAGLFNPNRPSYLILFLNNICQLRCGSCLYWDSMQTKPQELSLLEIEKIALSFKNLLQLTLTGGEPTLRKDLPKIPGIFAKRSNLAKCTVVTNGMLPERILDYTEEMVFDNPDVDFRIAVSVDAIGDLHDKIRGVKGSFENAVKTLELLYDLRCKVNNLWLDSVSVISKYNYQSMEETYNYIKKNFRVDNYMFAYVRGHTKEKDAKDLPAEIYTKMRKYLQEEPSRSKHFFQNPTIAVMNVVRREVEREIFQNKFHHYCSAGRKFIEIYHDGSVAPCELLESKVPLSDAIMGNIKEFDYNINKLLKSKQAKNVLDYIRKNKCHCTFECPKAMDVMYNKVFYPDLIKELAKKFLLGNNC